jgi:hypothetical protein
MRIPSSCIQEEGRILSTGFAQEKESGSYINKTSYIENCETSAVGRALGFCGYGIDDSLGSANEVANAMLQQEAMKDLATDAEKATLRALCAKAGIDVHDVLRAIGWTGGLLTKAQHGLALAWLKERGLI